MTGSAGAANSPCEPDGGLAGDDDHPTEPLVPLQPGRPADGLRPWLPWLAFGLAVGCLGPRLPADLIPAHAWWFGGVPLAGLALFAPGTWPWARRALLFLAAAILGTYLVQDRFQPVPVEGLVTVSGTVRSTRLQTLPHHPQVTTGQGLRLDRAVVEGEAQAPVLTGLRCQVLVFPLVQVGDEVRVQGRLGLHRRQGEMTLAITDGTLQITNRRKEGWRGFAWQAVQSLQPHEELAAALLFGWGQPEEQGAFRKAGLLHILVVSGSHLTLAFGLLALVLNRTPLAWPLRQGVLISFAVGYLWLTGNGVATLRAVLMALGLIAGSLLGRRIPVTSGLALAVLLLLVLDPASARTIGFQLSVVAVAGIVTLGLDLVRLRQQYMPLRPWLLDRPTWRFGLWCTRWTLDGLLVGLAASLAVMPLLALRFQFCYPWSWLTTLPVTVPITIILALGLPLLVLAGLLGPGLLAAPLCLLERSLAFLIWLIERIARLPGSQIQVDAPSPWLMLIWPVLFLPVRDRLDALLRLGAAGILVGWLVHG